MSLGVLPELRRARDFYGTSRLLRFLIADLRGKGLYTKQFLRSNSIFIHVPKSAGSSIAKALYGKEQGHYPCFLFKAVSPKKFKDAFKFGFVRNPWDRTVSAYHYLAQGGKIEADRVWAREFLSDINSFSDFVHRRLSLPKVLESVHFRNQSHFLCDSGGHIAVDYLGRFETLDRDFQYVAEMVKPDARLNSVNNSSHEDFRTYYDAKTRRIVSSVYREDIERFEYTF